MYIKCIFKICDKALVTAKALESFARKTEIADSVYKVAILKKSLNLIGPSGQHYGATYESRQSLKCI